jgi:SRSO17 transposase
MRDYVRGLLGPVGRKNSWQLAAYAGHATPHGLQHLLSHSRWDTDGLRHVRQLALGLLSDLARKNCWTIAEWTGPHTAHLQRIQRLFFFQSVHSWV